MKLYIIEGPDNTGKTTLSQGIFKYYTEQGVPADRILVTHFGVPEGNTPEKQAKNADNSYLDFAYTISDKKFQRKWDVIILDRAWYGEYVYGPIYRNRKKEDVAMMIRNVEDIIMNNMDPENIKLIVTTVDNVGFLDAHEDGKSLSAACKDSKSRYDKFFDEVQGFFDIIDSVTAIPDSVLLNVNVEMSKENFRDSKELLPEALLANEK